MPAGIGDQRLRRVEAHRLRPQQRRAEHRGVMQLEPRRVEHQRREAQRMTLRETEIGEGFQLLVDLLGYRPGDTVPVAHPVVEPVTQPPHLLGGPLGAHRPAQLVGLGRAETGTVHRQLHQLFLEQRHAEGFAQRRFHGRMVVDDLLETVAPLDVRVHRPALDGTGTDQRDLDHQVVEHPRFQPGQGGHLRAGLDLEHPDRIGALQHLVDRGFGQIQLREIHLDALVLVHQVDGVVQRRQHTQTQQIELHQTDCRAVIFVPLQHTAVRHTGPFHRTHICDRAIADHHAPGVDAHVPGQIGDLSGQVDHLFRDVLHIGRVGQAVPSADLLAPGVLLSLRETQCARHVPDRAAAPVGDHVGDLGGVVPAVVVVDILDDVLAQIRFDIDVDIGRPVTRRGQEPFEQQLVGDRIDVGDLERVTDRRVGRRSPALKEDVVLPAEPGDVVHHQEIAGKIQLVDDVQFMLDLLVGLRRTLRRTVAVPGAVTHQLPQPAGFGVPGRHVERWQLRGDQRQPERTLLPQVCCGRDDFGPEQPGHLLPRAQMRPAQRGQPAGRGVHRVAGPDRRHRHGQPATFRRREMRTGGRDHAQAEPRRQLGQRGIAFVIVRVAVVGEFDADPVGTEPVHQIGQRPLGRVRAAAGECLLDMPFSASGEDVPMPSGGLGQRVEVIARLALLTTGQVRRRDLTRQSPVALRSTSQHQQMRAGRVRQFGAGHVPQ